MRTGLVALLAWALIAPAAGAATVERTQRVDPFGAPYDSFFLTYTAAPGDANDLEIRIAADGITFHEAALPVTPKGCDQVDPTTVRCGAGDPITVVLGDGADAAGVVDARPPDPESGLSGVQIEAGPGADTVTGGPGSDVFTDGGPGGEADRFTGGGGDDRVSYAGREQPVRLTVGAPGEDVLAGIGTLEGGDGDDVLTGGGGADALWGGDGDDVIRGGGGSDDLDGAGGSDRLFGGAGRDELSGDDVASAVGRDLLDGGPGNDFLDLSASDDEQLSVGGPTFELQGDFRRDVARGGSGHDAVRFREPRDRLRGVEAEGLGDEFLVANRLKRVSRTRLRLRVGTVGDVFAEDVRIVLTPRGKSRPRLTKPVTIHDYTTRVRLRLTAAGVRYLRSHRAATLRTPDPLDEGTLAVRITR